MAAGEQDADCAGSEGRPCPAHVLAEGLVVRASADPAEKGDISLSLTLWEWELYVAHFLIIFWIHKVV